MPAIPQPEYPSIFHAADRASATRQREFVRLMMGQLVLLLVVTVFTNFASAGVFPDRVANALGIISASSMFITLGVAFFLRYNNPDERWFQCRALAENTKSLAWLYAMGASIPGPSGGSDDERFIAAVGEVRRRLTRTRNCLAEEGVGTDWVTPWMRKLRTSPIADRLAAIRAHRIGDQCAWYDRKSKFNASRDSLFHGIIFAVEILALAGAAWLVARLISKPEIDAIFQINAAAILATVSASLIAWTQFRKYGDLVSTYSIAADDLRLIDAAAASLESRLGTLSPDAAQAEFRSIVERAENAISREHSMWLGNKS